MRAGIRISSLVPSGLVIESVSDSSDSIILAVRSNTPPRDHATVCLRGTSLSAADFRRTVRGQRSPHPVAPDGTAGMHRPPFGVGTRRQTSSELRQAADAAG
jgi:hypothetical protein